MDNQIPQGPICQSCSMPMIKEGDFGKNADGGKNPDYCCYCWQSGEFTEPNITMDQMIDKVAGMLARMQNIPEDSAVEMTIHFLPKLNRWRK